MNALRWLASKNDVAIEKAQIVVIYRDWSKLEARRSSDYPRHQVQVFDVPLWALDHIGKWIYERVEAHQAARETLPECTPEERWEKPTVWAVMKEGRERAVKLHDSEQSAVKHREELGGKHYVQERPGEQVRCANYCSARPFCTQADALGVPK